MRTFPNADIFRDGIGFRPIPSSLWRCFCDKATADATLDLVKQKLQATYPGINLTLIVQDELDVGQLHANQFGEMIAYDANPGLPDFRIWEIVGTFTLSGSAKTYSINEWAGDIFDRQAFPDYSTDKSYLNPHAGRGGPNLRFLVSDQAFTPFDVQPDALVLPVELYWTSD